jgi:Ran GTPase-activating protein (RanGAP) involved in mRNA processing and transport
MTLLEVLGNADLGKWILSWLETPSVVALTALCKDMHQLRMTEAITAIGPSDLMPPRQGFMRLLEEGRCPRLVRLELGGGMEREALAGLVRALQGGHCRCLAALDLSDGCIDDDGAEQLAHGLVAAGGAPLALEELKLAGNIIGDRGMIALAATLLPACPQLRVLSLARNRSGSASVDGLSAVLLFEGVASNLEELTLSPRLHSPAEINTFTNALAKGACPRLTSLDLSGTALREAGVGSLVACLRAPALAGLKVLRLREVLMRHMGAARLASGLTGCCCTKLEVLDLTSNGIGDHGCLWLAHALHDGALPALKALILHDNYIGDVGFRQLASVLRRPLKELDLSCNLVHQHIIEMMSSIFTSASRSPSLCSLDLYNSSIGNLGMLAIASGLRDGSLGTLTTLRLGDEVRSTSGLGVLAEGLLLPRPHPHGLRELSLSGFSEHSEASRVQAMTLLCQAVETTLAPTLKALRLVKVAVGPANGAQNLCRALKHCRVLEALQLDVAGLKEQGFQHLAWAFTEGACRSIRELSLRGNQAGDGGSCRHVGSPRGRSAGRYHLPGAEQERHYPKGVRFLVSAWKKGPVGSSPILTSEGIRSRTKAS